MIDKVLKFGGSSVANADRILRVTDIVSRNQYPVVVVVSALSGVTDQLKALAQSSLEGAYQTGLDQLIIKHQQVIDALCTDDIQSEVSNYLSACMVEMQDMCQGIHLLQELSDRSIARIMSFGELMSSYIVYGAMRSSGHEVVRKDSRDFIRTSGNLLCAEVLLDETYAAIQSDFQDVQCTTVLPGFIGATSDGITTLLGRGGSDFTAAIVAAGIQAKELEIWSDVNGMLTANPRVVPTARTIERLSYNEAFELSHFGAKVLYPPAIHPAYHQGIPLILKNTFEPSHPGTRIDHISRSTEKIIQGMTSINDITLINLTGIGMVGIAGYSGRIFSALHQVGVNVVVIAQSCSERGICVAVSDEDAHKAEVALTQTFHNEISSGRIDPVEVEGDLSIVALVGDGMKITSGVSGRIFSKLGQYGVNIRAIAQGSSSSNVSIVIDSEKVSDALECLHRTYFESKAAPVHLFMAGVGQVGSQLLKIIQKEHESIEHQLGLELKVCGLINSRRMTLNLRGLARELQHLDDAHGQSADLGLFIAAIREAPLPNKVFVDNTATERIIPFYAKLIESGIHIVSSNKIAASGQLDYYLHLQTLAAHRLTEWRFETNVGAALPILQSIQDMRASGDKIRSIQAVLSGSLSYIFDRYDGQQSFAAIVQEAARMGYTEPNPLLDLSGEDVRRKLVILCRIAGIDLQLEDVIVDPYLPQQIHAVASPDAIYQVLHAHEPMFYEQYRRAQSSGAKLKYVATWDGNSARIGLAQVMPQDAFYSLSGTDNMVSIHSDRYHPQPLVIRGAGAGPELTAGGVLADILRIKFAR